MGPMLLLMFIISKTVQLRKITGFDSCYLRTLFFYKAGLAFGNSNTWPNWARLS
jgi:hypothetical protein